MRTTEGAIQNTDARAWLPENLFPSVGPGTQPLLYMYFPGFPHDSVHSRAGEPLAIACRSPLECWRHGIKNGVCLDPCWGLGTEHSAWDRGAADSMFDGWIEEYLSSLCTKNWGRQQCDNDVGSPKLKLCIKDGWQFQEPRAVAGDSAPIKDNGMWAPRPVILLLSTALSVINCFYNYAQWFSLHKDSATTELASSFKLNILKRAEISILHLFTDEKTFPNRQRSHFFFYSKDGQLFPVISITFPTYYFM